MMDPKYSVIVPVYNSEKTIRRCLDSLLDQNYTSMQIVLVNDGSADESDAICRQYADKWKTITYISKENGGVSAARNTGLRAATGEYITFVDSDDYVSENYFTQLDAMLEECGAEYIVFSHVETDGSKVTARIRQSFSSADPKTYFSKIGELIYTKVINSPCNKLYRRNIIQASGLSFYCDISIGEDRLFNMQYAMNCRSIHISEKLLYTVSTENENSLSRRLRNDLKEQFQRLEEATNLAVVQANLSREHKMYIQDALNFCEVRSVYSDAKRMHLSGSHWTDRQKYIWIKCKEINRKKLTIPKSRFCTMISLPVKFRLAAVIDIVAWRLAR